MRQPIYLKAVYSFKAVKQGTKNIGLLVNGANNRSSFTTNMVQRRHVASTFTYWTVYCTVLGTSVWCLLYLNNFTQVTFALTVLKFRWVSNQFFLLSHTLFIREK